MFQHLNDRWEERHSGKARRWSAAGQVSGESNLPGYTLGVAAS